MAASSPQRGILQADPFGGTLPPMFGPTFLGNIWFVSAAGGADGNAGNAPSQAFKTLAGALAHVVPGNNDVIFFSGTITLTAPLVWNASNTHLIGCNPQGEVGNLSKITYAGATSVTPLVHVTGSGCLFQNFSVQHLGTVATTAQVAWQDSGSHNTYDHVQLGGLGVAAQAAVVGSRSLLIDGGSGQSAPVTGNGDMLFQRCTFGLSAIPRAAANATLELQSASPRNVFRECRFTMLATASTPLHMLIGASGLDAWLEFQNCTFLNNIRGASGSAIAQAFSINATQTGLILFANSFSVGATKLETTASNIMFVTEPAASAAAGPYALNNT
jgi:hypothetical protein